MKRLLATFGVLLGVCSPVFSQSSDPRIIVTTPGYTSIYRYDLDSFAEQVRRDLRVPGASVKRTTVQDCTGAQIEIGGQCYKYTLDGNCDVIRLVYDRNRRKFRGAGFNFVESDTIRYEPPRFKGMTPEELPELWKEDLDRLFTDKSLLKDDEPNVFLIEAEIDENGMLNRVVELNGALRQYSRIIIDKIYDAAVRGWEPATRNGKPYRTLAHIRFEIEK